MHGGSVSAHSDGAGPGSRVRDPAPACAPGAGHRAPRPEPARRAIPPPDPDRRRQPGRRREPRHAALAERPPGAGGAHGRRGARAVRRGAARGRPARHRAAGHRRLRSLPPAPAERPGRRAHHRHDRLRQERDRQRSKDAGFDTHTVKPVELDHLMEPTSPRTARFPPSRSTPIQSFPEFRMAHATVP